MIRDDTPEVVKQANAAMEHASNDVLLRARRCKTPIVAWRDGQVVELDPCSPEFDQPKEQPPADHGQ
jgi:hypothetical protein